MDAQKALRQPDQPAPQASPLLQWLRNTSAPATDLVTLRRRLAGIPGSLSDAIGRFFMSKGDRYCWRTYFNLAKPTLLH